MLVRSGFVLLFVAGSVFSGEQRRQRVVTKRVDGQEVIQDNSIGALSSLAELLESSKVKAQEHIQKNIKTYIVTKKVPVPYTVQFETRVPYPVKIPIRRPYTVYVPKPYYVEVPKPVPFAVKVPVPHPFHLEKHIAIPYKVPIDKPVPIQITKPYPVYVEKKIPLAFEKPVPYQIKVPLHIPVERPVSVQIPVEKPVQVAVEKQVLFPIKVPVEKPAPTEGTTTYEVKIKEEEPENLSSETREYSSSMRSNNDFTPSPYDAFTSSLIAQGKQQKVISFLPGGTQTWQVQNQDQISYEPSTISEQTSTWSPINSTNDWIPRYVTSVQNNIYQDPFKFVPSPQHGTVMEPKPASVENKSLQHTFKNEIQPTFQSQIYNFVAPSDKPVVQKYQENPFSSIQHESKKIESDGNYQFFNVHSSQGSKSEPQISGVSFQRYETEAKPSEETPSQWVQYPQDQSQNNFQQEQPIGQQIKKEDTFQPQATNLVPQQAPQDFNPQNYHQYKVYYQGPNQDHFQKNHQPQYLQHDTIQHELSQNQFNNQNFPQLQQYQQQQINSPQQQSQDYQLQSQEFHRQNQDYHQQTGVPAQQIQQSNGMTSYTSQALETQYLHQTVTPAEQKSDGDFGKQYSQRRRQVQRSYQRQTTIQPTSDSTNITSTEPTPRHLKKSRRRTRKRLANTTTETTTPSF